MPAYYGLNCMSCLQPMAGIHSYAARRECVECGGVALLVSTRRRQRDETKKAERDKIRA